MIREFNGSNIRQNHKTDMFNAKDLIDAGNKLGKKMGRAEKLLKNYFATEGYKEFEKALIWDGVSEEDIKQSKTGKNGGTWVHPLLFVDIAMWISPEFKVKALRWIADELTKNRDASGESFKQMNVNLNLHYGDAFNDVTVYKKISNHIAACCGVGTKKNRWQDATEEQLRKRDDIQKAISMFAGEKDTLASCVMTAISKFNSIN